MNVGEKAEPEHLAHKPAWSPIVLVPGWTGGGHRFKGAKPNARPSPNQDGRSLGLAPAAGPAPRPTLPSSTPASCLTFYHWLVHPPEEYVTTLTLRGSKCTNWLNSCGCLQKCIKHLTLNFTSLRKFNKSNGVFATTSRCGNAMCSLPQEVNKLNFPHFLSLYLFYL